MAACGVTKGGGSVLKQRSNGSTINVAVEAEQDDLPDVQLKVDAADGSEDDREVLLDDQELK